MAYAPRAKVRASEQRKPINFPGPPSSSDLEHKSHNVKDSIFESGDAADRQLRRENNTSTTFPLGRLKEVAGEALKVVAEQSASILNKANSPILPVLSNLPLVTGSAQQRRRLESHPDDSISKRLRSQPQVSSGAVSKSDARQHSVSRKKGGLNQPAPKPIEKRSGLRVAGKVNFDLQDKERVHNEVSFVLKPLGGLRSRRVTRNGAATSVASLNDENRGTQTTSEMRPLKTGNMVQAEGPGRKATQRKAGRPRKNAKIPSTVLGSEEQIDNHSANTRMPQSGPAPPVRPTHKLERSNASIVGTEPRAPGSKGGLPLPVNNSESSEKGQTANTAFTQAQHGSQLDSDQRPAVSDDESSAQANDAIVEDEEYGDTEDHTDAVGEKDIRDRGGDTPEVELFNQKSCWRKVLYAAKNVGWDTRDPHSERVKIKIRTDTLKRFLRQVNEVSRIYDEILLVTDSDITAGLEARLKAGLQLLELQLDRIDEGRAGKKSSHMITDIYAHGIPQLVFLLEHAFAARSRLYSAAGETRVLKEIVRLLNLMTELCKTARMWVVRPRTELPIIKPTYHVISPNLRHIRDTFERELQERLEVKKEVGEAAKRAEMYSIREALWEEKRERNQREKEAKQLQSAVDALKISGLEPSRAVPRSLRQSMVLNQWSFEQDDELLRLLLEFENQPVERRYSSVLNTPLLQNKLAEHIRTRALELKPSMEQSYLQDNLDIPHWVSSLE